MKKFLAIVLIAVMMMAMGTVAFAEDTYTITIDGAANGETYTAYKRKLSIYDMLAFHEFKYTCHYLILPSGNGMVLLDKAVKPNILQKHILRRIRVSLRITVP